MEVITDPVLIESAQQDGRKLIIIMALALGALFHSALSSFAFDVYLITSLFENGKRPNFFKVLTRLTYFFAKFIGFFYFITALLITQKGVNCSIISRCHQIAFYVLQISNHWLFASRNLATWRTHRLFPFIFAYSVVGLAVLFLLSICCVWDGKVGRVVEPLGCVFAIDRTTRPRLAFSATLLFSCIVYHSINMILAAVRFANLADSSRRNSSDKLPFWKWPIRLLAVKVPRDQSGAKVEGSAPDALAKLLIVHGLHYWTICLLSSLIFVALPLLCQIESWLLAGGILTYAYIDAELGGRIFRDTITLAQMARAPMSSTGNTSQGLIKSDNSGRVAMAPVLKSVITPREDILEYRLASPYKNQHSRSNFSQDGTCIQHEIAPGTPTSQIPSIDNPSLSRSIPFTSNLTDAPAAFDDESEIDMDVLPLSPIHLYRPQQQR